MSALKLEYFRFDAPRQRWVLAAAVSTTLGWLLATVASLVDLRQGDAIAQWLSLSQRNYPVVEVATMLVLGFPAVIGCASAVCALCDMRESKLAASIMLAASVALVVFLVKAVY